MLEQEDYLPSTNAVEIPHDYHIACALLLDTSGSMSCGGNAGESPIDELNTALQGFKENMIQQLGSNAAAVDVCLITFGHDGVTLHSDFTPVTKLDVPVLEAGGQTPMVEALELAMMKVQQRKGQYVEIGIPYHRPWIFLFTDGEPYPVTDEEWAGIVNEINDGAAHNHWKCYGVGIGRNYNKEKMKQLVGPQLFEIKSESFEEMFSFLGQSISVVVNSQGDQSKIGPTPVPSEIKIVMD